MRVTFTQCCPYCQKDDGLYRVRQPVWGKVLLLPFRRRAYYCHHCDNSFLLLGEGRRRLMTD